MHESEVKLRVSEVEAHPLVMRHLSKRGACVRHLFAAIESIEHLAKPRETIFNRAPTSRKHVRRIPRNLEASRQRLAARHAALHEWRDQANDEWHFRFGRSTV
ncbi:MAG: hypothetical protein RIR10_817, partial [Planctomycetota bacterium]